MQTFEIAGVRMHPLSMDHSVSLIEEMIEVGGVHQHVVVNAAKIAQAQTDLELRQSINNADLINIDGMSVVWAARALGQPVPERVAGIDLMLRLVDLAASRGWGVFLLGATADVVAATAAALRRRAPQLRVVGTHHGYWSPEEEASVVQEVASAAPHILFVAMPSPRKEHFIGRHKDLMTIPFVMGVGGSFDVIAGKTARAPLWMQRVGLEWFFRLLQEPRRMFLRYLRGNTRFLTLVFAEFRKARSS